MMVALRPDKGRRIDPRNRRMVVSAAEDAAASIARSERGSTGYSGVVIRYFHGVSIWVYAHQDQVEPESNLMQHKIFTEYIKQT